MADEDYERTINPYSPFQGGNNQWLNLGASYLLGGGQSAHMGGFQTNMTSMHQRMSQFQDYNAMYSMLAASPPETRTLQATIPQKMAKEFKEAGGGQFTQQDADAVASTVKVMVDAARAIGSSGYTSRVALDAISGGANYDNVAIALQHQYKRVRDPFTGGNLSSEYVQSASQEMYRTLFGNVERPNVMGAYGASAADLTPMLEYMARHSQLTTDTEMSVFGTNKDLIRRFQSAGTRPEDRRTIANAFRSAGVTEDTIEQLVVNPALTDDDKQLEVLAAKASGSRIGESLKSLKNLTNAFNTLVDPNNVQSINDVFASMDRLTAAYGGQFSSDKLASIVRQTSAIARPMGLGVEAIEAMGVQNSNIFRALGIRGAYSQFAQPYAMADLQASRSSGYGAVGAYGKLTDAEASAANAMNIGEYAVSDDLAFIASFNRRIESTAEFNDNAAGQRLQRVIEDIEAERPIQDREFMRMSNAERRGLVLEGVKSGGNLLASIDEDMSSPIMRSRMAGQLGDYGIRMGRAAQRRELQGMLNDDIAQFSLANEYAGSEGVAGSQAEALTGAFFAMNNKFTKNDRTLKEGLFITLSDEERKLFGADESQQKMAIGKLATELSTRMAKRGGGVVALTDTHQQFSDDMLNRTAEQVDIVSVKERFEYATQGLATKNAVDLLNRASSVITTKLDSNEEFSMAEVLNSSLGSLTEKDIVGYPELVKAMTQLHSEYGDEVSKLVGMTDPNDRRLQMNKIGEFKKQLGNMDDFFRSKIEVAEGQSKTESALSKSSAPDVRLGSKAGLESFSSKLAGLASSPYQGEQNLYADIMAAADDGKSLGSLVGSVNYQLQDKKYKQGLDRLISEVAENAEMKPYADNLRAYKSVAPAVDLNSTRSRSVGEWLGDKVQETAGAAGDAALPLSLLGPKGMVAGAAITGANAALGVDDEYELAKPGGNTASGALDSLATRAGAAKQGWGSWLWYGAGKAIRGVGTGVGAIGGGAVGLIGGGVGAAAGGGVGAYGGYKVTDYLTDFIGMGREDEQADLKQQGYEALKLEAATDKNYVPVSEDDKSAAKPEDVSSSTNISSQNVTMTGIPVFNHLQIVCDGVTISAENARAQSSAAKAVV